MFGGTGDHGRDQGVDRWRDLLDRDSRPHLSALMNAHPVAGPPLQQQAAELVTDCCEKIRDRLLQDMVEKGN